MDFAALRFGLNHRRKWENVYNVRRLGTAIHNRAFEHRQYVGGSQQTCVCSQSEREGQNENIKSSGEIISGSWLPGAGLLASWSASEGATQRDRRSNVYHNHEEKIEEEGGCERSIGGFQLLREFRQQHCKHEIEEPQEENWRFSQHFDRVLRYRCHFL